MDNPRDHLAKAVECHCNAMGMPKEEPKINEKEKVLTDAADKSVR